jgi:hypothetical protein
VHTRQRCREIFVTSTMLVTVLLVLALTGCAGLSRGAAGDPPPGAPVSGAFGFDIHNALTSWPQEPFAWWRLWDAGVDWSRVEPSANQFDFSLMDQYVALAREHNVKIIYVLGNTPPWASTDPSRTGTQGVPGGTSPPKDMQQWQNFVAAVVTRYKGKIAEPVTTEPVTEARVTREPVTEDPAVEDRDAVAPIDERAAENASRTAYPPR